MFLSEGKSVDANLGYPAIALANENVGEFKDKDTLSGHEMSTLTAIPITYPKSIVPGKHKLSSTTEDMSLQRLHGPLLSPPSSYTSIRIGFVPSIMIHIRGRPTTKGIKQYGITDWRQGVDGGTGSYRLMRTCRRHVEDRGTAFIANEIRYRTR